MNDSLKKVLDDMAFFEEFNGRVFPAKAYRNAVRTLSELDFEVDEAEQVKGLPTIGDGIFKKIQAWLTSGTFPRYEEFKASPAAKLRELAGIKGIGINKAKQLFANGIGSLDDLREQTKGLKVGSKIQLKDGVLTFTKAMKVGLDYEAHTDKTRMPIEVHDAITAPMIEKIKTFPEVSAVAAAGSARRYDGSEGYTVGDADIIIGVSKTTPELLKTLEGLLDEVVMSGATKISGIKDRRQVDIRITNEKRYGALLLHATGPMTFNVYCRRVAIKKGWTLNEYGLFNAETHELLSCGEKEILDMLGIGWVDPKDRKMLS